MIWGYRYFRTAPFEGFKVTCRTRGSADINMIGAAVVIHITVLGILYMQVVSLAVSQQGSTLANIFKHWGTPIVTPPNILTNSWITSCRALESAG